MTFFSPLEIFLACKSRAKFSYSLRSAFNWLISFSLSNIGSIDLKYFKSTSPSFLPKSTHPKPSLCDSSPLVGSFLADSTSASISSFEAFFRFLKQKVIYTRLNYMQVGSVSKRSN